MTTVPPAWLPAVVSSVTVVLALCGFIWQMQRARFNHSVDLLFRLESDFFGAAKKVQRVKASRDLQQGKVLEAEPILDFFETMALLLRRGALDTEIVCHTFFYWIDNYYEACKGFIEERQATDPLVWKDLPPFVAKLRSFESKQLGGKPYVAPTTARIAAFLAEEQTEAA